MTRIETFEKQILLREIDNVWQRIREKKLHIMNLLATYFSEEKQLTEFVVRYELRFRFIDVEQLNLSKQLHELERMATEDAIEEEGEFSVLKRRSSDIVEDNGALDNEKATSTPSETPKPQFNRDNFFNDSNYTSAAVQSPSPAIKKLVDTKHVVSETFRWMYHPRNVEQENAFYNARASLLNEVLADPRYDEIDILLRMPFEEQDQKIWYNPVAKGDGEANIDRLYRFLLWDFLLDIASERADSISASPPHQLYKEFLEWKARDMDLELYFQELEESRIREIQKLKNQIAHHRSEPH